MLMDSLDASGDGLVGYAEFADKIVELAAEASLQAAQMAAEASAAAASQLDDDASLTFDFEKPEDAARKLLLAVVGRAAR